MYTAFVGSSTKPKRNRFGLVIFCRTLAACIREGAAEGDTIVAWSKSGARKGLYIVRQGRSGLRAYRV